MNHRRVTILSSVPSGRIAEALDFWKGADRSFQRLLELASFE